MKADWLKIKSEYITTDTSYRKLAKKYGLSMVQVSRVGKAEGWVELRQQFVSDTLAQTLEKTADADSSRLARLMDTTSKAIDVVVEAFSDEKQFNRHIITESYGSGLTQTEERVYAKVDTKALRDLTTVLKDLTGLMRDFYNIPTPAQAEAQRIAAARLAMDQRKAESEDSEDNDLNVTFEAGPEAWNE